MNDDSIRQTKAAESQRRDAPATEQTSGRTADAAPAYGMRIAVKLPYERAVDRVREVLGAEGFGVLTEIDVKATLKKKLDADFRPYVILGACNPPMAYQALSAERDIGLLLPCNVIVYAGDKEGESVVAAVDPEVSIGRVGNPALAPVAADVKARLRRVLDDVART